MVAASGTTHLPSTTGATDRALYPKLAVAAVLFAFCRLRCYPAREARGARGIGGTPRWLTPAVGRSRVARAAKEHHAEPPLWTFITTRDGPHWQSPAQGGPPSRLAGSRRGPLKSGAALAPPLRCGCVPDMMSGGTCIIEPVARLRGFANGVTASYSMVRRRRPCT